MSAKKSNLTPLGYDMVVATTQGALNATMLEYLNNREQVEGVTSCFVWRKFVVDGKKVSKLVTMTLAEVVAGTPGADPFQISNDADPDSDVNLQRLRFFGFAAAYVRL